MGESKLDHIEGARTLAAVWIVVLHVLDYEDAKRTASPPPESPFNAGIARASVGVTFFIVLSGFITHWVYGRPKRWDGDIMKFYSGRLDRVLLTSTLFVLTFTAIAKITGVVTIMFGDMGALTFPQLLGCLTFVQSYIDPGGSDTGYICPDSSVWTVGVLIPSWLLYPLYRWLLVAAEERGDGAFAAAVLLLTAGWATTFATLLAICAAQGFNLTIHQCMREWRCCEA